MMFDDVSRTGSITLDLNRIPKPAKNPKKCTLRLLRTDGKIPTLNLFKNKRCKGWWPVAAREKDEESGEENLILKVCRCCLLMPQKNMPLFTGPVCTGSV